MNIETQTVITFTDIVGMRGTQRTLRNEPTNSMFCGMTQALPYYTLLACAKRQTPKNSVPPSGLATRNTLPRKFQGKQSAAPDRIPEAWSPLQRTRRRRSRRRCCRETASSHQRRQSGCQCSWRRRLEHGAAASAAIS